MPTLFSVLPEDFVASGSRSLRPLAYLFLFVLCMGLYIPGLATMPATDKDEASFAQATKQMIETGDYTDIRFQNKTRYKKPAGIYWLQAASVELLNPDHLSEIWAYRLPSALGATIAVLMTAALGALLFGPGVGMVAAIMMAGCVALDFEAHMAKTDAMLLACVLLAQYALAYAYIGKVRGIGIPLLFWSAVGAGFLIKGPIILLIVVSTLWWVRYFDKDLDWFKQMKPWLGIPYALLIAAPWFIAIVLESHGKFIQDSAGHDMIAKLWEGQDRGILPPGAHLLMFPITFFPFSLLAMLAIPDCWRDRRRLPVRFCLGWIIPTWIVFEISMTKLPHYTLPVFPAIAMLAARELEDGYPRLAQGGWRWFSIAVKALWCLSGAGLALALVLLPYVLDHVWNPYAIMGGILLVVLMGVSLAMLPRFRASSVIVMTLGALMVSSLTFGDVLPNVRNLWLSREVLRTAELIKPCEHIKLASAGYEQPSLVFLGGTNTLIALSGSRIAHEMQRDRCTIGLVTDHYLNQFLTGFPDSPVQPFVAATLHGYDLGHGDWTNITFYIMPPFQYPPEQP